MNERARKRQKLENDNEKIKEKAQNGISEEDQNAIKVLEEELAYLELKRERMKTENQNLKKVAGEIKSCKSRIEKIKNQYKVKIIKDDESDDQNEESLRVKKIKIFPNKEQRVILDQWFGTRRFVYNQCVEYFNDQNLMYQNNSKKRIVKLCREYLHANVYKTQKYQWIDKHHSSIKDTSVVDFAIALRRQLDIRQDKLDNGDEYDFNMKFRSKKEMPIQSFYIEKRDWNWKTGTFAFLKTIKTKRKERLPLKAEHRLVISRNSNGHYYVHISYTPKSKKYETANGIVSLDPGVRTFQTCFDTDGNVLEWGENDMKYIYKIMMKCDTLKSKMSFLKTIMSVHSNTRKEKAWFRLKHMKYRAAWRKMTHRLRNKIDEMHKILCNYLVRNYKMIVLPKFGSKKMSKKSLRKISNKTTRKMLTWRHYAFRQRLIHKVKTTPGCYLFISDESYTSKTCSKCGFIHNKLGSSKTFNCPKCKNHVIDRDVNGARNILLRFIEHTSVGVGGVTLDAFAR